MPLPTPDGPTMIKGFTRVADVVDMLATCSLARSVRFVVVVVLKIQTGFCLAADSVDSSSKEQTTKRRKSDECCSKSRSSKEQ